MFPDWISQSPDWISRRKINCSTVHLNLPSNLSHNFLALILCSKFSRDGKAKAYYSVETNTNNFVWRHGFLSLRYYYHDYDDYNGTSCIDVVPRTIFSVTDGDDRIEFKAHQEYYSQDVTLLTEKPKILGIHLLCKPEVIVFDKSDRSTIYVDEERRHSSKRLKHS